ncbi:hypothetical protein SAMN05444162_4549 [Paenibacillaceae bacterium GAS479]|nr:hypothetical protein SAMN05444162_4549 [Paenibacillaceae bacterium GAS479]
MDKKYTLEFHHIGKPIIQMNAGERFSPLFGMYTVDGENRDIHIQHHRFEPNSPLNENIRNQIHIAFKTNNIKEALKDKEIIMPLYEPFDGYKCAMVLLDGVPIEIIETTLSEEQLWDKGNYKGGKLYPDEK